MKGNGQINLLTSTTMRVEGVAHYHERPVIAAFAQLSAAIERCAGETAARLLSIPEIGFSKARNVSLVTWYTELPGPFQALTELPPEARAVAEATLQSRLHALIETADTETLRLLSLALNLPTPDDILVHGDDIVLIRWGFLGEQGTALADWLPEGFVVKAKIATPSPQAEAGSETGGPAKALGPSSSQPATQPAAQPLAPPSGPMGVPAPHSRDRLRSGAMAALLGVALLLAAFLTYMLWPGNLAYPAAQGLLDDAQAQQALRGSNAATLEEIKRLRAALSGNVCTADPAALRDLGGLPVLPGRVPAPPADGRAAPGAPSTPPDTQPRDSAPPPPQGEQTPPPAGRQTEGSLLEKLDKGTVLVIGQTAKGVSMGTGILIAPDRVLTNYHVVEKVTGKISISNQHTGGLVPARVLAHTPNSNFGHGDFALLTLDRPLDLPRMPFAATVERLDSVVAAGYPSFVMSSDPGFTAAVRGGDVSRLGEVLMAVTRGEITTKQPGRNGITVLAHSATTSPGNSGGPLVDACGRVVGVNTYIRSDSSISLRLNYALSAQDAVAFLKQNNMEVEPETTSCAPAAAAAPVPPASPPPTTGNTPQGTRESTRPGPDASPSQPGPAQPAPAKPPSPTPPPARSSIEWPLLERIERGTVSLSMSGKLEATGTLVSSTRAITILSSVPSSVLLQVKNLHIKEPVTARILARMPLNGSGGDLLLLGLDRPLDLGRLPLGTTAPSVGNDVLSAGYTDWRNVTSTELEWRSGKIVSKPPSGQAGLAIISHTARAEMQNVGGPLLDACGRVVAIVDYVFLGGGNPRPGIAIPSSEVITFLKRNGMDVPTDPTPCQPQARVALPPDGSLRMTEHGERKFSTRGSAQ